VGSGERGGGDARSEGYAADGDSGGSQGSGVGQGGGAGRGVKELSEFVVAGQVEVTCTVHCRLVKVVALLMVVEA